MPAKPKDTENTGDVSFLTFLGIDVPFAFLLSF
jgi:hypothetical protein